MIKITLPDGAVKEYPKGTTALQIAQSISEGLARNVLAAKVNLSTSQYLTKSKYPRQVSKYGMPRAL